LQDVKSLLFATTLIISLLAAQADAGASAERGLYAEGAAVVEDEVFCRR
jgi:hypothetical protein